VRRSLELHSPDGRPYYLGVFLLGAYQETLGEVHNLFGDTDTVHIRLGADGRHRIEQVIEADRVEQILSWVQYDRGMLAERVRLATEHALHRGEITLDEAAVMRQHFARVLSGNTYLEGTASDQEDS
jgi:arginine decarboxylase